MAQIMNTVTSAICLILFLFGCGGSEEEPDFVDGTCVSDYSATRYDNENHCVYPSSFVMSSYQGSDWCNEEFHTLHPLRADGSRLPCADVGYPVRCSNCTGRDFYYQEGKVCKDCSGEGGSSTGGSSSGGCDYSGCVSVCIEAGGTNCGEDCRCD